MWKLSFPRNKIINVVVSLLLLTIAYVSVYNLIYLALSFCMQRKSLAAGASLELTSMVVRFWSIILVSFGANLLLSFIYWIPVKGKRPIYETIAFIKKSLSFRNAMTRRATDTTDLHNHLDWRAGTNFSDWCISVNVGMLKEISLVDPEISLLRWTYLHVLLLRCSQTINGILLIFVQIGLRTPIGISEKLWRWVLVQYNQSLPS